MGKRSSGETIAKIYLAFIEQRVWRQPELAEFAGVNVRTLRARLDELSSGGMPLERDEREFPTIYWCVPPGWIPGGAVLASKDVTAVVRILARSAASRERDAVLKKLLGLDSATPLRPNETPQSDDESIVSVLEDAAAQKKAVRMNYFTASRGDARMRHVSVQRVMYGARIRVVAICHRSGTLKWFRVANIASAVVDPGEPFREEKSGMVAQFVATSVDGWREGRAPLHCAFVVREPEARWVAKNLPHAEAAVTPSDRGICVSLCTAGLDVLARFVVGLGDAASVETPELAARVEELARGALARARAARPAVLGLPVKARDRVATQEARPRRGP